MNVIRYLLIKIGVSKQKFYLKEEINEIKNLIFKKL
jgi:hypothetical protein